MKIPLIFLYLIPLSCLPMRILPVSGQDGDLEHVVVRPGHYDRAFPNPMKGFRSSGTKAEDYPTLSRLYIRWNEIENAEEDGIEKILDYCDQKWRDLPGRNVKVIPRVYLEWPYDSQNPDNSRDTVSDEWGNVQYCERYWPVELSLLDPLSRKPVWKGIFPDADIRQWLPGDRWDPRAGKYSVEPASHVISGEFRLPGTLRAGAYILALSILDPTGNVPSVRFAVKNYFAGGRHPVGRIGVNKRLEDHALDESEFDDLYGDRSLYYVYNPDRN